MKNTALTHVHEKLNAKMVPFAGYLMPVSYAGINEEHATVREGVGVFDVSHMGEFFLRGENALALIQKISTNDASKLEPGKAQYSCMPNAEGGVVDDLLIYMMAENEYMLVVNAANIEKDWNWISSQNDLGVEMEDKSDDYSLLAIQGPKAIEALQSLTSVDLANQKYYTFSVDKFAGQDNVIISATGYTGSGGFEIYVPNNVVEAVWEKVFEAGASFGIKPIGLAARDTLRLEKGYCLYGNDITDETTPLEAGLGWITKFKKEADFIAKDILLKQKEEGLKRKLVGFELVDRGIPRAGYDIVDVNGNKIGFITSGTMSPSLKKAIGLGYVSTDFSAIGSEVFIAIRDKKITAKVVKFPFL